MRYCVSLFTFFLVALLVRATSFRSLQTEISLLAAKNANLSTRSRLHHNLHIASRKPSKLFSASDPNGNGRKFLRFTATNVLLWSNAIAFLITMNNPLLVRKLMKVNFRISQGELYRLFTSLFLHGDAGHVIMNCMSLAQVGPRIESMFGSSRFLGIYLASGVLANTFTFAVGASPLALGASGCTFGLLGAYAAHFYFNRHALGRISEMQLDSIKRTVGLNLIYGFMTPNIDNFAHIGGFLVGAILTYFVGPKYVSRGRNGQFLIHNRRPAYLERALQAIGINPRSGRTDIESLIRRQNLEKYGDLSQD